ncbi:MAG: AraC family transcriptional regulator [Mesorhizobium sp.]|nr:MAG: AraC family transcriptional regulator [Mesorhizobium sp.]
MLTAMLRPRPRLAPVTSAILVMREVLSSEVMGTTCGKSVSSCCRFLAWTCLFLQIWIGLPHRICQNVRISCLILLQVLPEAPPPFILRKPVRVEPTDADVADVALRLMRLLDRPFALPVLQGPLLREIHFWLLAGRHGSALRSLGGADGHAQRIARAVAMIRESYARPIRIEELAEAAGMSTSSFHQHFRQTTTLSPLQFQKQLRLIEARRQMLADGTSVRSAAYAVGYESVPQFTREYGRLFGKPPARDIRRAQMAA